MKRREFMELGAALMMGSALAPKALASRSRFQYCMLKVGNAWNQRERALVKLSFEIQKRCNIPVESQYATSTLRSAAGVESPFFIISGNRGFETPSLEDGRLFRLVLGAGGLLLFDDHSPKGNQDFYNSAKAFMAQVYPSAPDPLVIPQDHAVYQSYYLLKQPRGRLDRENYLEGWGVGQRTTAFFSHNDLLGAMEADQLGNWKHNMELGGSFRRELCFRLAINLTYYSLTINYKKDRAFPPIIERRRRL